ncbi:MAG: hypothetical protein JXA71_09655 [Chitinispirillaceae bacterium]|nr:hypothetical protein [Chitinispirillaceae bacterium]
MRFLTGRRACRPFFLLMVLAAVSFAGTGVSNVTEALDAGRYDAAYEYFQTAFSRGLSEDSLYYFWAEIYCRRGVLDTALALNIAARRKNAGGLTIPLLQQRYVIYATLGWAEEAGEIVDSLQFLQSRQPLRETRAGENRLAPRFSVMNWSGLNVRNIFEEQPYPFRKSVPVLGRVVNPGQDITLKSSWYFPFVKGTALQPAISYNFSNGIEQGNLRLDSLNHALGISLGVTNLWRFFSIGYSLQQRSSIFGGVSTQNTVSLSRLRQGNRWLAYSSLMGIMESSREEAGSFQSVLLMNYFSCRLSAATDIALSPLVSCFLTGDLSTPVPVMYIEAPAANPVTHYTDATCTQTVPIPSGPLTPVQQRELLAAYREAAVPQGFIRAPESFAAATPSVGIMHKLSAKFSVEGTLKGMAYYYLKEHEWISSAAPGDTMLAFSNGDGRYYSVEEFSNITSGETYGGPLEMASCSKRRIDFGMGGDAALKWRVGKTGTLRLNAYVNKYWSSLRDELPAEIKDLLYGVGLFFAVSFGREDVPEAL